MGVIIAQWNYSPSNSWPDPYGAPQCRIPATLQGSWFSREDGNNVKTDIDESSINNLGTCVEFISHSYDNFTFILRQRDCYRCVRILIRTLNVLEKVESKCWWWTSMLLTY